MPQCPVCTSELTTVRQRGGLFYHCPSCDGRAVTLPQIRRVCGDRAATALSRSINSNPISGQRPCPFCRQPMRVFAATNPPLTLDACKTCGTVWFDPAEFQVMPEGALESVDAVRMRGVEDQALWRLEQLRPRGITEDGPDEGWKTIPAFFGLPIESDAPELSRQPWLTWSLSLVIVAVSVWAFFHLDAAVEEFGFIPANAWRRGGLTFLTSFFLHGGVWHLIGNLYFLLIFGDNVEDYVGRWRYALLILASTIAGDSVHLLAQWNSTQPCVGASGGISGVVVFYALQFPRARLGFLFRYFVYFRWIQMPAWVALVLWLLLQTFTAMMQASGFSNVAATAHFGGALAGFVLWLAWRKRGVL